MIMCFTFARVLGVTSLWMLLPCLVALQRMDLAFIHILFCLHLVILCTASVVFWYHPLKGTTWHQLDRCCAATFIFNTACYLMLTHPSIESVVLWLALTVCAAWGSHFFWLQGSSWCHLLMHLVFRYVAYWGAHAILVNNAISPSETMLITRMYFFFCMPAFVCCGLCFVNMSFCSAATKRQNVPVTCYIACCACKASILPPNCFCIDVHFHKRHAVLLINAVL